MIFTKSAFFNKGAKSVDFRVVWRAKNHENSPQICICKRDRNYPWICTELHRFPLHFGLQNTPPNHLKIDSGSFWRQSGIDLVLQGRICMDSERPGLDFSLIWVRFLLDFWMYRAWLLQTIAGHILYSALACANLLLELLQETAARIYLRLSVTPCSAAVRAQHLESTKIRRAACQRLAC